jgi:broad specificity phosphatase PhoE
MGNPGSLAAVDKMVQRHPRQATLLADHGAVNKVIIAALVGLDFPDLE